MEVCARACLLRAPPVMRAGDLRMVESGKIGLVSFAHPVDDVFVALPPPPFDLPTCLPRELTLLYLREAFTRGVTVCSNYVSDLQELTGDCLLVHLDRFQLNPATQIRGKKRGYETFIAGFTDQGEIRIFHQ